MPIYGLIICLLFGLIYFIPIKSVNSQSSYYNYNNYPYNNQSASYSPNVANHENVLIILDSSYSMEDEINNERKIETAKRVINNVLSQLSPDIWVGLRIYGHKTGFLGYKACRASELVVPLGPKNQVMIANELLKIKPVGLTPITYSLEQAVTNDFNGLTGKRRIILVSDGMETCDGSPCDYVLSLIKNNVDLKIDVIGFDLTDEAAVSQLKCTAFATKGKFYAANDGNGLANSLIQSFNSVKEVQGKILNKGFGR